MGADSEYVGKIWTTYTGKVGSACAFGDEALCRGVWWNRLKPQKVLWLRDGKGAGGM